MLRKMAAVLKPLLAGCKCIDIYVAFVKRSGVKQLKEALNPEAELRLITGTEFSITEPDALKE